MRTVTGIALGYSLALSAFLCSGCGADEFDRMGVMELKARAMKYKENLLEQKQIFGGYIYELALSPTVSRTDPPAAEMMEMAAREIQAMQDELCGSCVDDCFIADWPTFMRILEELKQRGVDTSDLKLEPPKRRFKQEKEVPSNWPKKIRI